MNEFDREEKVKEKSWNATLTFFVGKDLEYKDNQDSLSQAGIANSATTDVVVNDQIQQLQTALSSVMAKQEQNDLHMLDIATAMSNGKENSPPLNPAYAPPAAPASDLQQILAAITNSTKPTLPPKPKTELQQILAFLTTKAGGGGGGGGSSPRVTRS